MFDRLLRSQVQPRPLFYILGLLTTFHKMDLYTLMYIQDSQRSCDIPNMMCSTQRPASSIQTNCPYNHSIYIKCVKCHDVDRGLKYMALHSHLFSLVAVIIDK
jgi:hypothetical protein